MSATHTAVRVAIPLDLLCAEVLPRCDLATYKAVALTCKTLREERVQLSDTFERDNQHRNCNHRFYRVVVRTRWMQGGRPDGMTHTHTEPRGCIPVWYPRDVRVQTSYRRGLKHGRVVTTRAGVLHEIANWTNGEDNGTTFIYDSLGRLSVTAVLHCWFEAFVYDTPLDTVPSDSTYVSWPLDCASMFSNVERTRYKTSRLWWHESCTCHICRGQYRRKRIHYGKDGTGEVVDGPRRLD